MSEYSASAGWPGWAAERNADWHEVQRTQAETGLIRKSGLGAQ